MLTPNQTRRLAKLVLKRTGCRHDQPGREIPAVAAAVTGQSISFTATYQTTGRTFGRLIKLGSVDLAALLALWREFCSKHGHRFPVRPGARVAFLCGHNGNGTPKVVHARLGDEYTTRDTWRGAGGRRLRRASRIVGSTTCRTATHTLDPSDVEPWLV